MKLYEVISPFSHNGVGLLVGNLIELDEANALDLIAMHYVKETTQPKKKKPKKAA